MPFARILTATLLLPGLLPLSSALIGLAVGWSAAALHAPLMRCYRHWRARAGHEGRSAPLGTPPQPARGGVAPSTSARPRG